MTNLPSPQRAGRDYQVGCQVAGSDPPPSISWQLLDPSGTQPPHPSDIPLIFYILYAATGTFRLPLLKLAGTPPPILSWQLPVVGIGIPPTPHPQASVTPPPVLGGVAHSLVREGVGESQFQRGDFLCGTLNICMYFVL